MTDESTAPTTRDRAADPVLSARGMRARLARSMGHRGPQSGNPVLEPLFNAVRG